METSTLQVVYLMFALPVYTTGGLIIKLSDSSTTYITIPGNETVSLTFDDVDVTTRFVVVQVHSQVETVSLTSSQDFTRPTTKTGTSVGLVSMVTVTQKKVMWYVKTSADYNVTVLAHSMSYTVNDPIPGGCNEVFNLEEDPNIQLNYTQHWTQVWWQWANIASPDKFPMYDCETAMVSDLLEYNVYVLYMDPLNLEEDHFFNSVSKMLNPTDIIRHGYKVYSIADTPNSKSVMKVLSSSGKGAVYSVLVKRTDNDTHAAYITSVSYGCQLGTDCSAKSSPEEIILAVLLGAIGVFLLCFGHRFFKTSQAIFAFSFFGFLTYILTFWSGGLGSIASLCVCGGAGVLGALLWLVMWNYLGLPILNVFLVGLCGGYLLAATLFFTPFGNISWWSSELNYSMAFTCVGMLYAVALMAYSKLLNIVTCGIVGAYVLLMAAAIPLHSTLAHIFLNAFYRQTVSGFLNVLIATPLNTEELILRLAWPFLAACGVIFQFVRERGHQPFPVPAYVQRRKRNMMTSPTRYLVEENEVVRAQNGASGIDEDRQRLLDPAASHHDNNERSGLIANSSHADYESIGADSREKLSGES